MSQSPATAETQHMHLLTTIQMVIQNISVGMGVCYE